MPTYQYACRNDECANRFELVQSFTDPSASECPVCGGPVRKVYGSVGVVFKGSGFYRNDSRATGSSTDPKSESKSDAKSESKSDSKSESKSESKSDSSTKSDSSSSTAKSDSSSGSSGSSGSSSSGSSKAAASA